MIDPVSFSIGRRAGTSSGGFGPEDEGKVVSHGKLAVQTERTLTDVGEFDTTTNNRVLVDIQGADGRKF